MGEQNNNTQTEKSHSYVWWTEEPWAHLSNLGKENERKSSQRNKCLSWLWKAEQEVARWRTGEQNIQGRRDNVNEGVTMRNSMVSSEKGQPRIVMT